jgi:hypothetical protein
MALFARRSPATQERMALPSMITAQAPLRRPQPNGPLSSKSLRSACEQWHSDRRRRPILPLTRIKIFAMSGSFFGLLVFFPCRCVQYWDAKSGNQPMVICQTGLLRISKVIKSSRSILANLDAGNPCRHDEDRHFHVLQASVSS